MTIVLQHQFWDLEVGEDSFSVTLSFQKQLERLVIPFAAVRGFADPSVNFALEFAVPRSQAGQARRRCRPRRRAEAAGTPADKPPEKPTGEVVTLDSFRKR